MTLPLLRKLDPKPAVLALLPLGLWGMLWLSLGSALPGSFLHPRDATSLATSIRSVLPFAAAFIGIVVIVARLWRRNPSGFGFISPIGLITVYGLVGIAASLLSPDLKVALYWSAAYVAVPIVLWAAIWGPQPIVQIQRLINVTWLLIIVAALGLFTVALLELSLWDAILHPARLFDCSNSGWYDLTSGRLRATGVGRFAAIGAIIALGGIWQRNWRYLWGPVFLALLSLLLFTGARGAFIGFAAGAPLMVLAYLSKRTLVLVLVALAIIVPVFWVTDTHQPFLDNCLLRGWVDVVRPAPIPSQETQLAQTRPEGGAEQPVSSAEQVSPETQQQPSPQQQIELGTSASPRLLAGTWELVQILPGQGQAGADETLKPQEFQVPLGGAVLNLVAPRDPTVTDTLSQQQVSPQNQGQTGADQPVRIRVPSGGVVLDLVSAANQTDPDASDQSGQDISAGLKLSPGVWEIRQITAKSADTVETVQPADIVEPVEANDPWLVFPREGLFAFTGRTVVWEQALTLIRESPLLGYGFHADRLLMGQHMHNSILHALIQTGLIGTIPFVAAIAFAWLLLFKVFRDLSSLPGAHKHMVIQAGGVLAFLTARSLPESTGAFFGIDWLILAVLLLYLQVVNSTRAQVQGPS